MSNVKTQRIQRRHTSRYRHRAKDLSAHICECSTIFGDDTTSTTNKEQHGKEDDDLKELVVIGAGPHAMTLILRLLEPEADLLSDKERHSNMHHAKRMKPIKDVTRHVQDISRGRHSSILLKNKTLTTNNKRNSKDDDDDTATTNPPPIDLIKLRKSVLIIDKSTKTDNSGGWLSYWNQNFDAIQIPILRSPMNAHADPFDHRSLEFFAEVNGREDELVELKYIKKSKQRDEEFRGPYQAPSKSLFKDFHSLLCKAYGIDDMVQTSAEVVSVVPKEPPYGREEPYFEVHVRKVITNNTTTGGGGNQIKEKETEGSATTVIIKTRRVVCAMGPMFKTGCQFWESSSFLPPNSYHRILHCHEIVPWLHLHQKQYGNQNNNNNNNNDEDNNISETKSSCRLSLLIVGGGVTSSHLVLQAARSSWCKSVTLIQRSRIKERQFDLDNKWMGPGRGKLLDEFWSLDSPCRAQFMKEARQGGSIPPELAHKLSEISQSSPGRVQVKEEVQISHVRWDDDEEQFYIQLDDGSSELCFDMIWLATGADNDIELYEALRGLREHLPIETVSGLPVLKSDLSWKRPNNDDNEPSWKDILRRRLYVMGSLAGLELGPDALNLIGARHGAVRVAKAIRLDVQNSTKNIG